MVTGSLQAKLTLLSGRSVIGDGLACGAGVAVALLADALLADALGGTEAIGDTAAVGVCVQPAMASPATIAASSLISWIETRRVGRRYSS
jgi:hypothetical protein